MTFEHTSGKFENVEWELLAGSGSLAEDGTYTVDAEAADKFAVVTASAEVEGFTFSNFLILPIPLVDVNTVVEVLA